MKVSCYSVAMNHSCVIRFATARGEFIDKIGLSLLMSYLSCASLQWLVGTKRDPTRKEGENQNRENSMELMSLCS